MTGNAAVSTFIHTSDPEVFLNLLQFSNIAKFTDITVKNIIYTGILFFSGDGFFSYVWTSFALYVFCIVLVYKLSNLHKHNNYYGLIGVFIYSTFFDMLLSVFGINVHVSETMFLLLIFYFYEKSNTFIDKKYSIAYLLAMLFAFFERESVLIYLSVFLLFTFFILIKKKNYFMLGCNLLLVAIISFMILNSSGSLYLVNKLGHWYIYLKDMGFSIQLKLPYLILDALLKQALGAIPIFYQLLFAFCVVFKIFFRQTRNIMYFVLIDGFILFILGLYCLTIVPASPALMGGVFEGKGAIIADVLPLFAFISIGFVNFFYLYKQYRVKIIAVTVALFMFTPAGILRSSVFVLKNQDKLCRIDEDKNHKILFAAADDFKFFLDKQDYHAFLFSLETMDGEIKTALPEREDSYTKALAGFYDKMERAYQQSDIGNLYMSIVADIILVNGCKRMHVSEESIDAYAYDFGLDKNKVYKMLISGYSIKDNHIFKDVKLFELTEWKIEIGGQNLILKLYGIRENLL